MHLGDVGRRRDLAGADRPDRLVGDDQLALLPLVGQRAGELARDDRRDARPPARSASLSPTQTIADEAAGERGRGLGADLRVALVLLGAALAMADDDQPARRLP